PAKAVPVRSTPTTAPGHPCHKVSSFCDWDPGRVMASIVTRIFTAILEFVRPAEVSGPSTARKMAGLRWPGGGPSLARGKLLGIRLVEDNERRAAGMTNR